MLGQDPLNDLLPFHACLTHLASDKIHTMLFEVFKMSLDGTDVALKLEENPTIPNDPRRKALAAMKCSYECQEESLMDLPEA